jgi:hypothetical protein
LKKQQVEGFQALKDALCSSDIVAYTDFTFTFTFTTHASRVTLAAVLSQVQNGIEIIRS